MENTTDTIAISRIKEFLLQAKEYIPALSNTNQKRLLDVSLSACIKIIDPAYDPLTTNERNILNTALYVAGSKTELGWQIDTTPQTIRLWLRGVNRPRVDSLQAMQGYINGKRRATRVLKRSSSRFITKEKSLVSTLLLGETQCPTTQSQ